MKIKILTSNYALKSFDCRDSDLNDFLLNDAKLFAEKKIANPFYEKNGFKMLLSSDTDKHTRAMYFDLFEME